MQKTLHKLTPNELDTLNTVIIGVNKAKLATTEEQFMHNAQVAFNYLRQVIRGRLD